MMGLLTSMIGGRGGRMLGGMVGGRTGAMIGGLAGSLIGGRQLSRLGRNLTKGGNPFGGGDDKKDGGQAQFADGEEDSISTDEAEALVRAMCNSAKADGHVDADEAAKISGELGDEVSADERAFLEAEMAAPMRSPSEMAREVPSSVRAEAYAVSVFTVDVDSIDEAEYLKEFAAALDLSSDQVEEIHAELGVS